MHNKDYLQAGYNIVHNDITRYAFIPRDVSISTVLILIVLDVPAWWCSLLPLSFTTMCTCVAACTCSYICVGVYVYTNEYNNYGV